MKANKAGQNLRRKGALERLEKSLAEFKTHNDEKVREKFRIPAGKSVVVRSHDAEIARMEKEIEILKKRIR